MDKSRKQVIKAVVLTVAVADCLGIYLVSHRLDNAVPDAVRYAPVAYTVPPEFPGSSAAGAASHLAEAAATPIVPAAAVTATTVAPVRLAAATTPAPVRAAAPKPAARTITAKAETPASFASLTSPLHSAARARTTILEHAVADAAPSPRRARVAKLAHPAGSTGFDAAFGGIAGDAGTIAVNNQLENTVPVLDLAGPGAPDFALAQNQAAMPDAVTQTITPLPTPAAAPAGELPPLGAPISLPVSAPAG